MWIVIETDIHNEKPVVHGGVLCETEEAAMQYLVDCSTGICHRYNGSVTGRKTPIITNIRPAKGA